MCVSNGRLVARRQHRDDRHSRRKTRLDTGRRILEDERQAIKRIIQLSEKRLRAAGVTGPVFPQQPTRRRRTVRSRPPFSV